MPQHYIRPGTRVRRHVGGVCATVVRCYNRLAFCETDDGAQVYYHVWDVDILPTNTR